MFEIDFYETDSGHSEIREFLEDLRLRMHTNRDARIQFTQVTYYIQLLADNGTQLPRNITKPIVEDIWELRPGSNRVFYFYFDGDGTYVLLHHFRKKSQETPKREKAKALRERDDYIGRHRL